MKQMVNLVTKAPGGMLYEEEYGEMEEYTEAVAKLKEMGFTNVRAEALGDIGWGCFYNENDVKQIVINGSTQFSVGDIFAKDVEIVVKYHSKKQ